MAEFKPIGLLDFQSREGHFAPLFNNFSQSSGILPCRDQTLSQHNQNFDLETSKEPRLSQRKSSSQVKTCNLEELLSNCSLMYVSGDSQGLDSTKLQLEFCTNNCCNSRVKYARVHREREREKETDIWSSKGSKFNAIAPLSGAAVGQSSWDLGSDGASTPGSASWGDVFGGVARPSSQWPPQAGAGPGAGDLGWPASSNAVLFEAPRVGHVEPFLDTWAACDALLETDNTAFEEGADLISDQWSQISNKSRKPKL